MNTNNKATYYATIWSDLRNAADKCGWALALHGSLAKDMDIMAMPWTEDATDAEGLITKLAEVIGYFPAEVVLKLKVKKVRGRVAYAIPISGDGFYMDISVMEDNI